MLRRLQLLFVAVAAGCVLSAGAAWGVDGVLEINQACAVNSGCFPGDTAGFPVTITASGSYRLTGELSVGSGAVTAIEITADFVGVDLNGFSIAGVTTCSPPSGTVTGCSNTGAGVGIQSSNTGVAIERGFVRNMGSQGIEVLGDGSAVTDVGVSSNGGNGVQLGSTGIVRDCVSGRNGGDGIVVGAGSQVLQSLASGNAGDGIDAGSSSHIIDNHISENGSNGIRALSVSVVRGNVAVGNAATGIHVLEDGIVKDNTSAYNAIGLDLGVPGTTSPSSYSGNVLNENTTALANDGNGIETGTNICANNTTCP